MVDVFKGGEGVVTLHFLLLNAKQINGKYLVLDFWFDPNEKKSRSFDFCSPLKSGKKAGKADLLD